MTTIILGDTHGRPNWKAIIKDVAFDKIIFIGDYFDTHERITVKQQLTNFEEIVNFKKTTDKEVILLIGNHDYHYFSEVDEQYSGYNNSKSFEINQLLEANKKLLQMCHLETNVLFTHAGVTKTWLSKYNIDKSNIADGINDLFIYKPLSFSFNNNVGNNYDVYGDDITHSPIWVRPDSLMQDGVDFVQVVGHTTQERPISINDKFWFIDALGTSGEFLIMNDGVISVHSVAY